MPKKNPKIFIYYSLSLSLLSSAFWGYCLSWFYFPSTTPHYFRDCQEIEKITRQIFCIESHEIKYNAFLDSECVVVMVIYVSLEVWRNIDTKLIDIYCIVTYLYVKQPKRQSWDRRDLLLWSQSMLYKDNT